MKDDTSKIGSIRELINEKYVDYGRIQYHMYFRLTIFIIKLLNYPLHFHRDCCTTAILHILLLKFIQILD